MVLSLGFAHDVLSRAASTCPDASVSASPILLHVRGNKFWRPLKIYFSIPNLIISSGNGTVPIKMEASDLAGVLSRVQESYRKLTEYELQPGTDEYKVGIRTL